MLDSAYSFRLFSKSKIKENTTLNPEPQIVSDTLESDSKKRSFLKLAGVVGAGAVAATLIPRKAEALVFGSTPTSNTVGVKNSSNARINPATQETLDAVKTQTDLFTFDAGSNPANLKVNIAAGATGLKNTGGTSINPATEDTLAAIKSKTDLLSFTGDSLKTAGGSAASVVGLNDINSNQINPAADESVTYLRRIVKLMESQGTVDSANRQRVTIDSLGTGTAVTTTVPVSGTVTASVAAGTNAMGSITAIDGQNRQMFQDFAKSAYATGIRQFLVFS